MKFDKEKADFFLKTIGIFSIFLPIFLFYMGQNAENKRARLNKQVELYSELLVNTNKVKSISPTSKDFEEKHNFIFYDIYPKLLIFNDKNVLHQLDSLRILNEFMFDSKEVIDKNTLIDSLTNILLDSSEINKIKYIELYDKLNLNSSFYYYKNKTIDLGRKYLFINNSFIHNNYLKLDTLVIIYKDQIFQFQNNDSIPTGDISSIDLRVGKGYFYKNEIVDDFKIELKKRVKIIDSVVVHTIKSY